MTTRRRFLTAASAALAAPYFVPASARGKDGRPAPSERIVMACIGLGMQGMPNMDNFLGQPDCQVVAVCDVDQKHLADAKNKVNDKYKNTDCNAYTDFREVCTRPDVDALSLALPDHWHAIPAILGARHGKDIYGEKPLAHSIVEGRAMVEAVKQHARIWQTGSWQRSQPNFRLAAELVQNGYIGKLKHVEVGLPAGTHDFAGTAGKEAPTNPPPELDYDRWLGPAPYAPYAPARVHRNWRWHLDYGGGQLTDWIGHHCDIAHWGMGTQLTSPVEIEGKGEYLKEGLWNTATKYRVDTKYQSGVTMTIAGGHGEIRSGAKWIGADGWVWVDRGGIDASNKDWLKLGDAPKRINLYRSPGHQREFLDSVKSRRECLCPAEVAHRSFTPGHLGQIAMLIGRKLKYNPTTEQIEGDDAANRLLGKALREPWQL